MEEVRVSSHPYTPLTIRTESNLVQVDVVVRDGKGNAVSGLGQRDFRIFDEGKEQPIANFSVQSRQTAGGTMAVAASESIGAAPRAAPARASESKHVPRFIALYFDDLGTPIGDLRPTKIAAKRFIEDGLDSTDRVGLFTTSAGGITGFISDKKQLTEAIDKVQAHPRFSEGGLAPCPRITPYDAYLIANHIGGQVLQARVMEAQACGGMPPRVSAGYTVVLPQLDPLTQQVISQAEVTWDQVRVASLDTLDSISGALAALAQAPGSRMLLLVSSGFLAGTLEQERNRLVDRALRFGIVINALDAKGLFVEAPLRPFGTDPLPWGAPPQVQLWEIMAQVDSKEEASAAMAELALATGGLFFHHNNDYSFGFRELGSVPEVSYLLAFRPDAAAFNGKYHKLKVRLSISNSYGIEARPGYFAPPKAAAAEDARRAELEREVTTLDVVQGFPAAVAIQYGSKLPNGLAPAYVNTHVDIKGLQFPLQDGRRTQKLVFVAALLDQNGDIVSAREGSLEFALTQSKYDGLLQSGVNAQLHLEAPAGTYRLRVVALDCVEGKIASLAYAVHVP